MPLFRLRTVLPLLLFASASYAATFTVSSSDDSGPGTLRQAILDANANPGLDQIRFTTGGVTASGVSYPAITDRVDIDGSVGSAKVQITAAGFVDGSRLFHFASGSDNSILRDVVVTGYPIQVRISVNGVTVAASRFSGGMSVEGSQNLIGGTMAGEGNMNSATLTIFGDDNEVLRNEISNVHVLFADGNQIGTTGNGNTFAYINHQSSTSIIEGNTITYIEVSNALPPAPGPVIRGNTINGQIDLYASVTGTEITGNSFTNSSQPPIDLDGDGATPNDPAPDADTGGNNRQNFPVLTQATLTPSQLTVEGTLASTPLTTYLVELFGNPAGSPAAHTLLASFEVTSDASGNATFTRTINSPLPGGDDVVTSTATNRTTSDTSEVSAPVAILAAGGLGFDPATYSVNETDGTVTVTVQRTVGSDGAVTVDFATANGTATAPGDYATTAGTLTFGPGVTSQIIVIPIVSDSVPEAAESFSVTLTNATGGATMVTATATVTIAAHLPAVPIPTASTWALIGLTFGLVAFALAGLRT